jgi:hypothetical protein
MTPVAFARPAWEVADVIRRYGRAFLTRSGGGLTATQRAALRDLSACRTAALGGHVSACLDCGRERIAYNSCRNRHCPKCQALSRARWLAREAANLLPVEYFHVVFTLPGDVADLARANAAVMYDLLFRAASRTLREVAANPKRLGAQVGVLMVLHTWGQTLQHHPHVHAVVTGGGLSCDPRGVVHPAATWTACRPGFFLPVRVLGRVFRRLYLDGLRRAFAEGTLVLAGPRAALADPVRFDRWICAVGSREWVVYAKKPFGGPAQVLKYLARYTHRVALSNSRIVRVDQSGVAFRYRDSADDRRTKTMTLTGDEFLRRFVQHVLPRGFVKVRHYGLLAPRDRADRLALARRRLLVESVRRPASPSPEPACGVTPPAEPCCPHCGSPRLVTRELPGGVTSPDTS